VLSSSEELAGLFDELRDDGKETDVVKLRVVVLGEGEGGEQGLGEDAMQMIEHEADEPVATTAAAQAASEARATTETTDPSNSGSAGEGSPQVHSPHIIILRRDARLTGRASSTSQVATTAELTASAPANDVIASAEQDASAPATSVGSLSSLATPVAPDSVASDPPDEFITAETPTAGPAPAQRPSTAEPSLLSDLSSLFTSFASSPAMSALLNRAATGAYTPTLASSVQTHAASAAMQAAAAQGEIQRVLGQVHEELRKNGMHGVDGKLRELEAMTAGWTAQLRAGLSEVQRMAEERRAAAAAHCPEPDKEKMREADEKEPTSAESAASKPDSAATSSPASGAGPAMPGAFAPPAATLFGGFNVGMPTGARTTVDTRAAVPPYEYANRYPAPPGAPPAATQQRPHGSSLFAEFSAPPTMPTRQTGVAPGAYPAPMRTVRPVATSTSLFGGPALPHRMGALEERQKRGHLHFQRGCTPFARAAPPGSFPQHPASETPATDVTMANPWLDGPAVEVYQTRADGKGTLLEQVLGDLIEVGPRVFYSPRRRSWTDRLLPCKPSRPPQMQAMDVSTEPFLRGVLAAAPEAPGSELVLAGLQYHNHGLKEAVLELGPTSRRPRADGATAVLARQEVLRRLGEVRLCCYSFSVRNPLLIADPALTDRWASTSTTSSTLSTASSPSTHTPRSTTFLLRPSASPSVRSRGAADALLHSIARPVRTTPSSISTNILHHDLFLLASTLLRSLAVHLVVLPRSPPSPAYHAPSSPATHDAC
jgi:hypothetical protein